MQICSEFRPFVGMSRNAVRVCFPVFQTGGLEQETGAVRSGQRQLLLRQAV